MALTVTSIARLRPTADQQHLGASAVWLRARELAVRCAELVVLCTAAFGAYWATMAPGVTWKNGGDDGAELATAAFVWGIGRPPGYAAYLALVKVAQALPLGEPARAAAVFSATVAMLALVCVYLLTRYLLRESNWRSRVAATFAAAAFAFGPVFWSQAVIAEVYTLWDREQGNAAGIDGVIAIDRAALDRLLDAVGGVDVPELGGHVSSGTVEGALDDRRRSSEALRSYADYQRVKTESLSGLYRVLMAQITTARGTELTRALGALGTSAADKHLLVWFRDADLQGLAAERGWDGRLDAGSGDFTGVVNTTISYGKVMPYIDRSVSYTRQPDGAAVVELRYTNRFSAEDGTAWDPLIDGTWWDWRLIVFRRQPGVWLGYVRVLAPDGSRLLRSDGWDDAPTTDSEEAVTVFGAPVLVRPGETRTVHLVYADPAPLNAPLSVFRQPGT